MSWSDGTLTRINALIKFDKSEMRKSLEKWPGFAENALDLPINLQQPLKITNAIVLGMGTPNSVGKILEPWSRVPLIALDDWNIPPWVDEETLVLALSYSGNTGEVLKSTEQSLTQNSNVIAISTGGKLQKLGVKKGFPTITFEPVGRSGHAFPYLYLLSGRILAQFGLIDFIINSKPMIEALKNVWDNQDWIDIGEQLSQSRQILVCGGQKTVGLVTWIKHCLNENSKRLVIPLIIPEASHGEVEAYRELESSDSAIIIHEQNTATSDITNSLKVHKELLEEQEVKIFELNTNYPSRITNTICLAYQGIIISYWLALFHQVDPTPLPMIDSLKKKLSIV